MTEPLWVPDDKRNDPFKLERGKSGFAFVSTRAIKLAGQVLPAGQLYYCEEGESYPRRNYDSL